MTLATFRLYSSCKAKCNRIVCSSVDTSSAQIPRSDDDALEIKFSLYKETKHTFTPDRYTQEIWTIPYTTKVISVRPSEFYNLDSTSIMQSSSGLMIVNFINTHFPPEDKIHLPKIVATIIDLVQKFIPLVPNGFIHVRRIEGVEIVHHVDDEVTKAKIHNHFETTKRGTCAICLDDFEVGLNTSRLPCLHVFHGPCIVEWLDSDHHCPLCRYHHGLVHNTYLAFCSKESGCCVHAFELAWFCASEISLL